MAVNEFPGLVCASNWSQAPHHPVVAFVRDLYDGRYWRPRCEACLQILADDPDPVSYDVAYLDPTRQRRPDTVINCHGPDGTYIVSNPAI